MFKVITTTVLCFLFTLLSGCGPVYSTHYDFKPPSSTSGKRCLNTCLNSKVMCQANCRQSNQACRNNADRKATSDYLSYVYTQKQNNKPVNRTLDSFSYYGGCQNRCGCMANYRQCYSNCGGRVTAITRCTAFCDQESN